MRTFTINLSPGNYTLKDTLTQEVLSTNLTKGLTATRETLKNQIFVEILKRKTK